MTGKQALVVSHVVVGILAAALAVWIHQAFDAPLANVIAEIS